RQVNEPGRHEPAFFIEHERDPPGVFGDGLAALATRGPARRRALDGAETRQPVMLHAGARLTQKFVALRQIGRARVEPLDDGFRAPERRAAEMNPVRHLRLTVGKWIRQPLAESLLARRDPLAAASAFCPAAGRSFDDVRHVTRSPVYRDVDRRQTYTAGLPRGHGRMANASLLRRVRDLDWLWLFLASWILPFVIDGVSHLTYFRSLLFWLVPTILLLPRFLEYTDPGGRRRTALWITTAGI